MRKVKLNGEVYFGNFKYKYMPYGDGAKFLIENATIKFTDPREFNDPFDCMPSYSSESAMQLIETKKEIAKKAAKAMGLSPAQRIMSKGKMAANLRNAVNDGHWQDSIRRDVGVCSLTTKPCNLLMWAHYANNHTGLIAEFKNEIPSNPGLTEEYLVAFHVSYQDTKPVIDLDKSDFNHDLLIKGMDWKYEDEIRCLDVTRKAGIYNYRRELLESIILGCRFDPQKLIEVRELIEKVNREFGLKIKLYMAEMVKDKFKVFIPNHPVYGDPEWS